MGASPPPTFSNRFCGRMGGRWDPTFATRSHFGSSLREVEHLHPRAGPVLHSMSASPADIFDLLSAALPADIESSSESALSQESATDILSSTTTSDVQPRPLAALSGAGGAQSAIFELLSAASCRTSTHCWLQRWHSGDEPDGCRLPTHAAYGPTSWRLAASR